MNLISCQRSAFVTIANLWLIVAAHASTNTFTTSGLNVAIADDAYNGNLASMASVNLPVVLNATIQHVNVTVGITHTWIGDLVIKVRSPAGTVITLMSRPGVTETADDGTASGGDSSNLSGNFPITFDDAGPVSAELMGNSIANAGVVCQSDSICLFAPNAGAAAAGTLASFNGQTANGTWTLFVGDSGTGDTGTINQFSVTIVTPTPPTTNVVAATLQSAVQLCWPTTSGFYYQPQWSSQLNTNVWTNLGGETAGNGATNCLTELTGNINARFYRVLSHP